MVGKVVSYAVGGFGLALERGDAVSHVSRVAREQFFDGRQRHVELAQRRAPRALCVS
jgi:hypothetical protein